MRRALVLAAVAPVLALLLLAAAPAAAQTTTCNVTKARAELAALQVEIRGLLRAAQAYGVKLNATLAVEAQSILKVNASAISDCATLEQLIHEAEMVAEQLKAAVMSQVAVKARVTVEEQVARTLKAMLDELWCEVKELAKMGFNVTNITKLLVEAENLLMEGNVTGAQAVLQEAAQMVASAKAALEAAKIASMIVNITVRHPHHVEPAALEHMLELLRKVKSMINVTNLTLMERIVEAEALVNITCNAMKMYHEEHINPLDAMYMELQHRIAKLNATIQRLMAVAEEYNLTNVTRMLVEAEQLLVKAEQVLPVSVKEALIYVAKAEAIVHAAEEYLHYYTHHYEHHPPHHHHPTPPAPPTPPVPPAPNATNTTGGGVNATTPRRHAAARRVPTTGPLAGYVVAYAGNSTVVDGVNLTAVVAWREVNVSIFGTMLVMHAGVLARNAGSSAVNVTIDDVRVVNEANGKGFSVNGAASATLKPGEARAVMVSFESLMRTPAVVTSLLGASIGSTVNVTVIVTVTVSTAGHSTTVSLAVSHVRVKLELGPLNMLEIVPA